MSDLTITTTATTKISGDLTADAITAFAKTVPGNAKIKVEVEPAVSQMDNTVTTVTATWDGEAKKQDVYTPAYPPGVR